MNGQASDIAAADAASDAVDRGGEGLSTLSAVSAPSTHRLDRAIRWTVCGMLAFAPAAFGGVDGWSESVLLLLAALIAVGLAIRSRRGGDGVRSNWAYLPLALFIMLIAVQLLPLPPGFVKVLSPHTW